jgi:glycosyltransferase involved in cell wall biosynthesis
VRSALNQTYKNLEVLVVVDGPDPATTVALEAVHEERLRIVTLPESVGGAEARNVGAREAKGEWIALLDDDDEWLPQKLDHQMRAASNIKSPDTIIACQYFDRRATGDVLRPQRLYRDDEPISEYLFCETSPFHPTRGFLATPTLLIPRSVLLRTPFTPGLQRNQDADWLLRVKSQPSSATINTVLGALAIVHNEFNSGRIGSNCDWRYSFHWAVSNRHLFTEKALGFFFSTHCAYSAVKQGDAFSGSLVLLHACWKYGKLSPMVLWFFFRHAALAPTFRLLAPMWLRTRVEKFRHQ